jgi:hypothetical protein
MFKNNAKIREHHEGSLEGIGSKKLIKNSLIKGKISNEDERRRNNDDLYFSASLDITDTEDE